MNKIVGWFIGLALLALLAYAWQSGLFADVFDPYTPPGNPHP